MRALFCAAHGANEFDRFLPRRVRGKKHFARSECTRLRRVRRAECDPTQKRQLMDMFMDARLKKSPNFAFIEVLDEKTFKLNAKIVREIVELLQVYKFRYEQKHEFLGNFFELLLNTSMKQEAGQFFTPRNIVRAMVEMLNPDEHTRVLDPACGSGGFLVMVLDHVRKKIAAEMYPELDEVLITEKYNSYEVNERVKNYAENSIFGFDFDPDLKKAARMNMVMAGDGHANIFHVNSLAYPNWEHPQEIEKIKTAIEESLKNMKDISTNYTPDARGKFDMVFTNPPFGTKVKVDKEIAERYHLSKYSDAPEVLFIEACYDFLKEGGKMAIVLPDGILGNPNTLPVREWILDKFKILASVDLAVEAFLPQVGVQASLLFLEKKTENQRNLVHDGGEDYDVFMAIAEKLGKDRRGVPIYVRDEDGAEILFEGEKKYLAYNEKGKSYVKSRKEKVKLLDDDLPNITKAYLEFLNS